MSTLKEQLFTVVQDHKDVIYNRFNVQSLSIFGSVARGSSKPDSDVDILVSYKKTPGFFDFLKLKEYLENILERRVDLVTEKALKKQLRKQIMQEAERVA